MAMESPKVTADVIEIKEFPDLAALYNIMGVPKTIINDGVQFTGAVTEDVLLERMLQAVDAEEPDDVPEQYSDLTTPIG